MYWSLDDVFYVQGQIFKDIQAYKYADSHLLEIN